MAWQVFSVRRLYEMWDVITRRMALVAAFARAIPVGLSLNLYLIIGIVVL